MRKKKYIIAALSAGMCLSVIPGSTVSAEKQQADSGISSVVNNASDAVNVVSQISGLGYMGNQSYVRSLHRNEDNSSGLVPDTEESWRHFRKILTGMVARKFLPLSMMAECIFRC